MLRSESAKNCVFAKMAGTNKLSDFSIEHILNRAGDKSVKRMINSTPQGLFCDYSKNVLIQNNNMNSTVVGNTTAISLNWLQYSRYHPPKLQRTHSKPGPAKRTPGRLPRVPFTPEQLSSLEEAYRRSSYLSSEEANKLADRLELSNVRVKIWFQNRRARERREKRELQLMTKRYTYQDSDSVDVETIDDSDGNTSNSSV